ncbi:uncharacterized protein LOC125799173 [Astyanax mexicanus]|uniref:uncharacterized protein LOC125799173 n=1 Tax=Astyanax mexicanus TaxID=7994 RepID=UPI0020CACF4E|nr:uncharacterized protein LOC125799173 [Astyanax mexicanus]
MIWRCFICCLFVAVTLRALLNHINTVHSRSPNFRVICGIDGCTQEYRVYNSFYYHVRRSHASHLLSRKCMRHSGDRTADKATEDSAGPCTSRYVPMQPRERCLENFDVPSIQSALEAREPTTASIPGCVVSDAGRSTAEHGRGHAAPAPDGAPPASTEDATLTVQEEQDEALPESSQLGESAIHEDTNVDLLKKHATAFVLSAREKHHLSQSAVNDIVAGVQNYQASLLDTLRNQMTRVFQRHPEATDQLLSESLDIFNNFEDPFARVSTTYMQDSAVKELFGVVEAQEIEIAQSACYKGQGPARALAVRSECIYYIPLIKSLEQLLSHPVVLSMFDKGVETCRAGFLKDIIDGDILKSHPLFSVRPNALQLILYTDEIELCNPLGSHASKNKLLMVYYTLGNIHPKYRSKLAAIRLLAIAKATDIAQCSIDVILNRIQEDLNLLYNGVRIKTVAGERVVYGALVSFCGDTLAQHEVTGFKEGVGFSFCKCRHCECSFEDMQIYFDEDSFVQRTLGWHIRQCNEIERASTDFLRNSLKTTYGINRKSKLVDFPSFDLIKQTPQDIMHVILEGVAPLEIKSVLKHLVLSGQLDLDTFNSAVLGYPYSVDVRDKPCPITVTTLSSNDNKLKQSSGQMLVLLKILPFVLDSFERSEYTEALTELIQIVQMLFAPVISLATISNLKSLINQHLVNMKQLFPENNITPKQHYLIHIPAQIKALGPMVRHMCMRFESKHCFFKQWSSKLNFKNVCKSLVKHNQMYESCQNVSSMDHPIFSKEVVMGPVSCVRDAQYVQGKLKDFLGVEKVHHIVSVKWLELNGNKFVCQKSVIIINEVEGSPVFGLIKDIFIADSSLYCFECQVYDTVAYNRGFLCYEIEVPNLAQATEFVDADKIVDYTSYYTISFKNHTYVPLKYYLGDVIGLHRCTTE